MPHPVNRRQKPGWKQAPRPGPPPPRREPSRRDLRRPAGKGQPAKPN